MAIYIHKFPKGGIASSRLKLIPQILIPAASGLLYLHLDNNSVFIVKGKSFGLSSYISVTLCKQNLFVDQVPHYWELVLFVCLPDV